MWSVGGGGADDKERLRREEDERERNRRAVIERKRQWETVNSDNDDDGRSNTSRRRSRSRSRSDDDDDDINDVDNSRDRHDRRRKKKHKRKKSERSGSRHHRRRSRSASSSSSDGSCDRETRKKHKNKDKKKKHHRSSKERRRRHRREEDNNVEAKRERKRRNGDCDYSSDSSSSLSENERDILENVIAKQSGTTDQTSSRGTTVFGKYGIINSTDQHSNSRIKVSFERWLAEVKGIPDFNGPRHELHEYFAEYAEDYNTATLPHIKYYDYDKWEMDEYSRKKQEAEKVKDGSTMNIASVAADELRHREEMAERAKRKRLEELKLVQYAMTAEKREEMKHQAQLRHEMAVAYKTGDEETRRRLQRKLEPDELVKR